MIFWRFSQGNYRHRFHARLVTLSTNKWQSLFTLQSVGDMFKVILSSKKFIQNKISTLTIRLHGYYIGCNVQHGASFLKVSLCKASPILT